MKGSVHSAARHDSALKHVTGQALYIDDMPEPPGTLHGALVLSPVASGRLARLDLSAAACFAGCRGGACGRRHPRHATTSPAPARTSRCLPWTASSSRASRWRWWWRHRSMPRGAAAERAVIEIEADRGDPRHRDGARASRPTCRRPRPCCAATPTTALKTRAARLSAEFSVGGQEHFYLEGQVAFALPGEDGDLVVHSSTQHPTEVQHVCAQTPGLRLQPRHHRGAPAGRRLRRQGEQRLVGGRRSGAGGAQDGQARKTPPAARDRHDRDRQAARLRLSLHGGLRRRRPRAGARRDRWRPMPAGASTDARRDRPRTHPHRQRLLDPALPRRGLRLQDQQAVEHGVPRLRRAAGCRGHGRCDRPHRTPSRTRRQRGARSQFLRRGAGRDALRPEGRGEPSRALLGRGEAGRRMGAAARRDRRFQQDQPDPEARAGTVPAEVRHLLQRGRT